MATKEALYMALDVSGSMSAHLPGITAALQGHLCDKMMHAKTDAFGLALVGTAGTENVCAESMGDYDHISISGAMGPVGIHRIQSVASIGAEDGAADAIDALVVATDALVTYVRKNKWAKRILLLTDGESLTATMDDDDMTSVATQLVDNGIQLDVVTIGALTRARTAADEDRDVAGSGDLGLEAAAEVWALLSALGARMDAQCEEKGLPPSLFRVSDWATVEAKWREPCRKAVRPTATFRGPLSIGGALLPVRVWKKVSGTSGVPVKFKNVSKTSATPAAAAADGGGGADDEGDEGGGAGPSGIASDSIITETRYFRASDPATDIAPELRVSAYRYGKDLIPLSGGAEEGLKFGVAEKCLELHGFVPQSAVPRHHFLSTSECVVGDDAVAGAREAVQALCLVMEEEQCAAIVRFASRAKAAPRLAVLWPGVKCLYLNQLPFKDEIKSLLWPPVRSEPPSDSQRAAADALVDALDLDAAARLGCQAGASCASSEADEVRIRDLAPDQRAILRRPKDVFNPQHARYFELIKQRALQPAAVLPPPPWASVHALQPDTALFAAATPARAAFRASFPLGALLKSTAKRVWKDDVSGDSEKRQRQLEEGGAAVEALPSLYEAGAEPPKIDSGRPVEQFWELLRWPGDHVVSAITQMAEVTLSLFAQASRPDDAAAAKAFRCLAELRRGCAEEEEPGRYNALLEQVKALWLPADAGVHASREAFWEALIAHPGLSAGLISSTESPDAAVSEADAKAFLLRGAPTAAAPAAPAAPAGGDGDYFDDLE